VETLRFHSAKAIRKWAIETHNCHPTEAFIRDWAMKNKYTVRGLWYEEDLLKMINEGDRAYAEVMAGTED
jgi:hypothetical protein